MAVVGKREFMHHASQYLKSAELGNEVVITHNGVPRLKLVKIKKHTARELAGFAGKVKIVGDINAPILGEFFDDFT